MKEMGNIFNTVSSFWGSEFMKDYKWIVIFMIVFCILATEFVCSIVFSHVILPRRRNVARYLLPKYQNVLAENEALKEDNIKLREELEKYKNTAE